MTTTATGTPRRLYYGWVIVLTVALASFSQTAGTFPVLSVLLGPINSEFGWSRTTFTAATTLGTLAGGVVSLFVGRVIDRIGGRWILACALFFLGLSFVLTAFMQTLWQFYALQVVGRMLTMGVVALSLQVIVPKWFVTKRGLAVALAGLGGMAGNAVTPVYVQQVVSLAGWRAAAMVAGVAVWVISVLPASFFLRRQPEDMGLLPDGVAPGQGTAAGVGAGSAAPEYSMTLAEVLRVPAFYLLAGSFTILFLVGPAIGLHLLPYLQDKGLSAGQGVLVIATWSASGAAGALITGLVSKRLGARRTLTGEFALMALCLVLLTAVRTFPVAIVWSFFIGLLIGGLFNTLYQVTLADYFGRQSLGKINGAVWPVQMVANAFGPLIAAMAYDGIGSYDLVFVLFGGLVFGCAGLVFFARPPRRPALVPND